MTRIYTAPLYDTNIFASYLVLCIGLRSLDLDLSSHRRHQHITRTLFHAILVLSLLPEHWVP
jgi:hypothetical protein